MEFKIIRSNKKVELVETLIKELDDLCEDLTYDNVKKEVKCIKTKIKIRKKIIKQLGRI